MHPIHKAVNLITRMSNVILERTIVPDEFYTNIEDVLDTIKDLKSNYGIALIIFDVDDTIRTKKEPLSEELKGTLKRISEEVKVALASNDYDKDIEEECKDMCIHYDGRVLKPFSKKLLEISNDHGIDSENTLIVGDGYLADIIGGKLVGMVTGHVKQYHSKKAPNIDGNER